MSPLRFSEAEYATKKRIIRREQFLTHMEELIPWQALENKLSPHYPRKGNGRPLYPLSTVLHVHCMQLLYNLSDPMVKNSLHEVESMV